MNVSRTAVTISSILLLIAAVLFLLGGIFLSITFGQTSAVYNDLVAEGALDRMSMEFYTGLTAFEIVAIVFLFVNGVFDALTGIFGLVGARNPARIMPFVVLSIIALIIGAGDFVLTMVASWTNNAAIDFASLIPSICGVFFGILCVWAGMRVKRDYDAGRLN